MVLSADSVATGKCPDDFTYVQSVNGCYKVVIQTGNWTEAALMCSAMNNDAHLVIANSEAEQKAIDGLLSSLSECLFVAFIC